MAGRAPARLDAAVGEPTATRLVSLGVRHAHCFATRKPESDDWAIFIDQAYSHLTFYVNGMRIGSGGPDTGLVPVLRGPLWVPVPRVLHRVSGDELLVRSDAGMRHTTLDRVHIGPAATLRPAYDHAYTMKRWLRSTSLSAMLSAAFIFGLLASLRRQESFYLWAACTVSAWTLHMVHSQFDMPPIEPAMWDAYGQITLGWFVLAGTLFTHRIIDAQAPRLERAIRTWAILGAAMLCIAPAFRMATIVNALVWLPSLLAAGVYMLVRLSKSLVTRGGHETAWFWSIAAIIFGVGAHDYITYFLWIAPGSEQFLPNTSLVLLVGLSRDLANQLLDRCGAVWNLYGPTETTIWSAFSQVRRGEGAVPIGRPAANTGLYVLDSHRQPVPVNVPGELYIGGAGLANGYLKRPELTAASFIASPIPEAGDGRLYQDRRSGSSDSER